MGLAPVHKGDGLQLYRCTHTHMHTRAHTRALPVWMGFAGGPKEVGCCQMSVSERRELGPWN